MNTGLIVFIRNLIIAASGFFLISKGVRHLNEGDAAFLLMIMLVINSQNTLYEGLFLTHTMSYKDRIAQSIYKNQFKVQFFIPLLSICFVFFYGTYILNLSISVLMYMILYFCFLTNLYAVGATNLFCTSQKHVLYFTLDIIATLLSVLIVILFTSKTLLVFSLITRVCGSAIASVVFHISSFKVKNVRNEEYPLFSLGYFSGTLLSLCRDSLSPLLIGWLIGPSALVAIRIFNTCYSAPGLIANAMNKIVVRFANKTNAPKHIFNYYLVSMYLMSLLYLAFWFIGGDTLYELLFGAKKYFPSESFLIALTLFCLFWPLGQTAIAKMIFLGASRLFLQVSLVWTVVSLVSLIFLVKYDLVIYIYILSISQSINVFILYKVAKYESTVKFNKKNKSTN